MWSELILYGILQQEASEALRATLVNTAELMLGVALPFLFFSFSLCLGEGQSGWVVSGMLIRLKFLAASKGKAFWLFQKERLCFVWINLLFRTTFPPYCEVYQVMFFFPNICIKINLLQFILYYFSSKRLHFVKQKVFVYVWYCCRNILLFTKVDELLS